jgi:site-specific DNA recombinase
MRASVAKPISARPEFQRLLREVKAGRFDIVLAVDADRYSRASDLTDWQTIKRTFREAHVRWGTPSQWMGDSEFITDVLSAVSADEKRKILARTQRGIREAVRQGRYFAANAPFGYRAEKGTILVNEAEAAVVRRIFDMAFHGTSIRSISLKLTAEGVPSPMAMRGDVRQGRGWRLTTVARILHNPIYTGVAEWGKTQRLDKSSVVPRPQNERIQVKVPAIIDASRFATVQANVKRHSTFLPHNQRRTYLLKGLFFCECGRRMSGTAWHGRRRLRLHRARDRSHLQAGWLGC